jgi:hypothetical protein
MKRKVANPNPQEKKWNQIEEKLAHKETEIEIEEEIEVLEDQKKHPQKNNFKK